MQNVIVKQHMLTGGVWLAAWLFTVGFVQLTFGQAILAILIWPYYLGVFLSVVPH